MDNQNKKIKKSFRCLDLQVLIPSREDSESELEFERPKRANQIDNQIWIGDAAAAADLEFFQENQITAVLNCSGDLNYHQNEMIDGKHVQYLQLDLEDRASADISQFFQIGSDFIQNVIENGEKILIHCQAGISRSSTMLLAYLMLYREMTLENALNFVREKRESIAPNIGFMAQLMIFEIGLRGESSLAHHPEYRCLLTPEERKMLSP